MVSMFLELDLEKDDVSTFLKDYICPSHNRRDFITMNAGTACNHGKLHIYVHYSTVYR